MCKCKHEGNTGGLGRNGLVEAGSSTQGTPEPQFMEPVPYYAGNEENLFDLKKELAQLVNELDSLAPGTTGHMRLAERRKTVVRLIGEIEHRNGMSGLVVDNEHQAEARERKKVAVTTDAWGNIYELRLEAAPGRNVAAPSNRRTTSGVTGNAGWVDKATNRGRAAVVPQFMPIKPYWET